MKRSADPQIHRTVRLAQPSDLRYILHLQNLWSNNVGFLPACTFERYIARRQILLVLQNDEPAGYLSFTTTHKGLLRVPQVAVDPQLLRTTIGTKIMRHLERAAIRNNLALIRLTSRSDLPANLFWPHLGFHPTAILTPQTKRQLPHIEWSKQLVEPTSIAQALLRHQIKPTMQALRPSAPLKLLSK